MADKGSEGRLARSRRRDRHRRRVDGAPGYSLAASVGFVTDSVAEKAPFIILFAFVPMGCIAAAFYYLNKADPDCGTNFTWGVRSFGPKAGWIAGWGCIVADLVIMPNLAGISGPVPGAAVQRERRRQHLAHDRSIGILFIAAMTWICWRGIELSARSQVLLLGTELIVLAVFAVIALSKSFGDGITRTIGDVEYSSVTPSLSWMSPSGLSSSGIIAGLVVAVFIYWGWDTCVSVNEEAKDSSRTTRPSGGALDGDPAGDLPDRHLWRRLAARPAVRHRQRRRGDLPARQGRAARLDGEAAGHLDPHVGRCVVPDHDPAGDPHDAVDGFARRGTAQARPDRPQAADPDFSTWLFGIGLSIAWYVLLVVISNNTDTDAYSASIAAVGMAIAVYYGLSGISCIVYYRASSLKSVKNFVLIGVLPGFGGIGAAVRVLQDRVGLAQRRLRLRHPVRQSARSW